MADIKDRLLALMEQGETAEVEFKSARGGITLDGEKMTFANPGMMLVSQQQYFKGRRSICRNPTLQKMFMLLGRAEKAGSGVDKIVEGWNYLGWDKPSIKEEVQPDFVVLTLPVGKDNTHQEKPTKKTPQEDKTPQENPPRKTHQEKPTKKTHQERGAFLVDSRIL